MNNPYFMTPNNILQKLKPLERHLTKLVKDVAIPPFNTTEAKIRIKRVLEESGKVEISIVFAALSIDMYVSYELLAFEDQLIYCVTTNVLRKYNQHTKGSAK